MFSCGAAHFNKGFLPLRFRVVVLCCCGLLLCGLSGLHTSCGSKLGLVVCCFPVCCFVIDFVI